MSAAATTSRLIIRAAASAILAVLMSVGCALIVVAATATFNFGYFCQTTGSQFGHSFSHGNCVGIENPDTTTAQAVEHSTANSASTNDDIDLLRCRAASAGTGINSDAFAADAIDHQQGWCSAKIGGDFGIKAFQLANRHTDFHFDNSLESLLQKSGRSLIWLQARTRKGFPASCISFQSVTD
jgi:hypothetical protein